MKPQLDISQLNQQQFEMILDALILLKQSNPQEEVYLNERYITKVVQEMMKMNKVSKMTSKMTSTVKATN